MTIAPASAQSTMLRSCGRLIGVSRGTMIETPPLLQHDVGSALDEVP